MTMSLSRTGRLSLPPRDARPIGGATEAASSSCWAGAESWANLTANGVGGVYAASVMPQTSCHAWKARVRSARYSVAVMRWWGRRKRLLIGIVTLTKCANDLQYERSRNQL